MKNLGCRLESNPGPLSSATSALATTTLVFQDLNIFSFILLSSIACCSLILNIPPIMYRQNTFRCRPVSFFFFPDPFRWESFYLVCMKGHLIIVMLKPFQSTNYGSFSRGRGVSRRHQKGIFIDVFCWWWSLEYETAASSTTQQYKRKMSRSWKPGLL